MHDVIQGSQSLADEQGLMPWRDVRDAWQAISGERLSRSRVWQIGLRAEAKLRAALADLEPECGGARLTLPRESTQHDRRCRDRLRRRAPA